MENNNMKFIQGAAAGAALAVAAGLFLTSQTGKKLRKELSGTVADFYEYAAPKMEKMGKITKNEFDEFIEDAVTRFAKLRKLSARATEDLMDEAKNSWDHFAKQIKE